MADYVEVLDSSSVSRKVAAKLIGDVYYQFSVFYFQSRSDTFTGAANGVAVDVSSIPCDHFTLQLTGTGATPSAWSVVLEGSLDGTTYTTLVTHQNGIETNGQTKTFSIAAPVKYFRSRCVSVTLGGASNLVVQILGQAG